MNVIQLFIRLFYRRIFLVMIAVLGLFVIAAQGEVPEFSTLEELLVWVGTGAGAMVLSGLVLAYLLENMTWWHGLPRLAKLAVPILLTTGFGALAQFVIVADLLTYIPPIAHTVILTLVGWLFSQLGYRAIKEGNYAARAKPVEGFNFVAGPDVSVPTSPVPPAG